MTPLRTGSPATLVLVALTLASAATAICEPERYEVLGSVIDTKGKPVQERAFT